jgi:hypothetical protein
MLDSVRYLVRNAKTGMEVGICFATALISFKVMLPAALSLAPALVRGCIKVKTLIPQSSIPGMFILVLPWLYSPLVWCIYQLVFQMIGNVFLLIGLVLLAFFPMFYFFIGYITRITTPTTEKKFAKTIQIMSTTTLFVSIVSYGLLAYFLFLAPKEPFVDNLVKEFIKPKVVISIMVSGFSKFLYTTLAGVDFMIYEIVDQRRHEVMLSTGFKDVRNAAQFFTNGEDHTNIQKIVADRNERLDDLSKLLNNSMNR